MNLCAGLRSAVCSKSSALLNRSAVGTVSTTETNISTIRCLHWPRGTKRECESAVNSKRPVNLDLGKFHFPLPAITSILHRISGIIIFVGVAFLLYGLDLSLSGEDGFNRVSGLLDSFLAKLIIWGILSALLYHLVAGIKHLLMDMGIGEELESGRLAAKATIVVSVILIILAGVWVW